MTTKILMKLKYLLIAVPIALLFAGLLSSPYKVFAKDTTIDTYIKLSRVSDEDMNPFEIRVELEALFTYDDGDERPDIHTTSFDQLFPFLRQISHSTTAMSGMPGLMIPIMKLDRNSVNVGKPEDSGETSPLN